jgi:hypothetical protein
MDREARRSIYPLVGSLLCGVVALILLSPVSFGLKRVCRLQSIVPVSGYEYRGGVPVFFTQEPARSLSSFEDHSVVTEDGHPLAAQGAFEGEIAGHGWGLFAFGKKGVVFFSSSDGTDPLRNHRIYEAVTSLIHAPDWLILLFAGASIILLRIALREPLLTTCFRERSAGIARCGASLAWLVIVASILLLILKPVESGNLFFHSLWLPILWSASAAVLIAAPERLHFNRFGGFLTLLLPVAASYCHFALGHASNFAFLVGGVLPWSDAYMHFLQVVEMAREGIAHTPFNGRFLYPAYFSSLLRITGMNLSLAHVAAGVLFSTALYQLLRRLLSRVGVAGGTLFTFLLWLYFRDRCTWLVMTEQLGVTMGLLALSFLLVTVQKRSFPTYLMALFLLGTGMSARPGALIVIPMLILFGGWCGWKGWIFPAWPAYGRVITALCLASMVASLGFCSNNLLQASLFRGKVIAYGNFSFTVNGLLRGTTWLDSYTRFHDNPRLVMQENIETFRKDPWSLPRGIRRAFETAWQTKFLYAFDSENRLRGIVTLLAILGLAALWLDSDCRDEALWISLIAAGILLSIPFAPPWDAAERPYAVTIPFQDFLAACGLGVFLRFCVLSPGSWVNSSRLAVPQRAPMLPLASVAILVCLLVFPIPMVHATLMRKEALAEIAPLPPRFLKGSSSKLDATGLELFRKGLTPFAIQCPKEVLAFLLIPQGGELGVNWNNLRRYGVMSGVSAVVERDGLLLDERLISK